jgi:hypothetical protein
LQKVAGSFLQILGSGVPRSCLSMSSSYSFPRARPGQQLVAEHAHHDDELEEFPVVVLKVHLSPQRRRLRGDELGQQELESAGLGGSLLSSGLSSTAFLNALLLVERRLSSGTGSEDVDRVIAWAMSEEGGIRYSAHRGAIANALLSPWANGDPEPTIKGVIQRFLLECLGDPRIDRGAWLAARETAREVIVRWLAQATLEQFLKVVDHVAERHQWDYRRAFWSAYI